MKKLIILILLISLQAHSSEKKVASSSDMCVNNFLGLMNIAATDNTGKMKKNIFAEKTDQELVNAYKQLSMMKDQSNSAEALALFKKVKPIIVKNAGKEFNLCVTMMNSIILGIKQVCPNLHEKDSQYQIKLNKCTEVAGQLPAVSANEESWKKAAKFLIMSK